MKKSLSILAVCAFVVAFAVAANAQTSGSTEPAKPAEPAKAAAPATTTAPKAHSSSSKSQAKPVLDLNSASKEDLMKLPGVGDATADKIIAGRPWKSRSELVSKNVCTKAQYEKFEHQVTAKQAAPAASK